MSRFVFQSKPPLCLFCLCLFIIIFITIVISKITITPKKTIKANLMYGEKKNKNKYLNCCLLAI